MYKCVPILIFCLFKKILDLKLVVDNIFKFGSERDYDKKYYERSHDNVCRRNKQLSSKIRL